MELIVVTALIVGLVIGFLISKNYSDYKASELTRIAHNKKVWAKARKEGRIGILMGKQIIIPAALKEFC